MVHPKKKLKDDYDLKNMFESGRMGKIMTAQSKHTQEVVAVKVIDKAKLESVSEEPPEIKESKESKKSKKSKKTKKHHKKSRVENFLKEVSILKLCDHPHIVKYISHYEDEQNHYIVMEYVPNGNLFDFVTELYTKHLHEDTSRTISAQLVSALEFCHRNLIAHRDIKLENILIADRDKMTVKLADFDLSTFVNPEYNHSTWCGTPVYASPEILTNAYGGYDPMLADVWSFGVAIYVMTAGRFPWHGDTVRSPEPLQHIISCIENPNKFTINYPSHFSSDLRDLLTEIFKPANQRITLLDIKNHNWLKAHILPSYIPVPQMTNSINIDTVFAVAEKFGFKPDDLTSALLHKKHNQMTVLYYLWDDRFGEILKRRSSASNSSNSRKSSDESSPRRSVTPRTKPISYLLSSDDLSDQDGRGSPDDFLTLRRNNICFNDRVIHSSGDEKGPSSVRRTCTNPIIFEYTKPNPHSAPNSARTKHDRQEMAKSS